MKLRQIEIKNFHGIKHFKWSLPDRQIFCLIGRGDSSKSTVLEAIRCVFYSHWTMQFTDSDFYNCNTALPIEIKVTFGELADEFCTEKKFASQLRGWDKSTLTLHDEAQPGDEDVLTACLRIESDLEPTWKIVSDRDEVGADFRAGDRNKVGLGMIGQLSEQQLSWARGTILAQITESENLNASLVDATRAARGSLEGQRAALEKFDAAASKSQAVAEALGVPVNTKYKAHLDLSAISIRMGGLTLHDGDMPLRMLGLGSRRMLLCGIQQAALEEQHITLFDELEYGLEPHRISRLVKNIKADKKGQYFLTTHSPTVLRELTVDDLYILRKEPEQVTLIPAAGEDLKDFNIQGNVRARAEAFLSKKVIVCEGATEVGFVRGLDYCWSLKAFPFSYLGIVCLDATGAGNIVGFAEGFKKLRYDVLVLADGDAQKNFSDEQAADLKSKGIEVIMWSEHLALEQRAMRDLPWSKVVESVVLAQELGFPVRENVCSKLKEAISPDIAAWKESGELRKAIGDAAKDCGWFKDISRGERWAELVFGALDLPAVQPSDFAAKLRQLRVWADK